MTSLRRCWAAWMLCAGAAVHADEGMWLLNQFPAAAVQAKYGFTPTQAWLDKVRLSSARLAGGCSASFVSAQGLVMTNHHCAHSCIEQLSTADKDFVKNGFFAARGEDELRCPEMEVNQLTGIRDVTDELNTATRGLEGKAFNDALKAGMTRLEKACATAEDVRCDVVSLFQGGRYHLYTYRRFQDVRLVFAPEFAMAFFGGDPDNFMFPRYDLDLTFVRVYRDGKPVRMEHYFPWAPAGVREGELTFVSGHPGRTSRNLTVAELENLRDFGIPERLFRLSELRGMLTEFQGRGPEQARTSNSMLFSVENGLKALKGRREALVDGEFFATKVTAEQALRAKVAADPALQAQYGKAWDEVARAVVAGRNLRKPFGMLEGAQGFMGDSFSIARTLVRAAAELPLSNEKRLREFTDAQLPQLKQQLFSTAPIHDEFEVALLTFSLTKLREVLGPDAPVVQQVLGKDSPAAVAARLVAGSTLKDVAARKVLFEGGQAAIAASRDPLVQLALAVDPEARAVRRRYEDEVESVLKKNAELVARARFAVQGTSSYPDATFTLRLSYGAVEGYEENGARVAPLTTLGGAFKRHTGSDPFALPPRWLAARERLALDTPFNMATSNDIIGGNSGSPVINRDAQVVGLIFDGNIQSLGGDYGFDPAANRAVAVHSAAILEALDKVYGATRLLEELRGQVPARKR
jgi:hypothetical protein